MSGVFNGDGPQPRSLFGVPLPDGTGAPASTGDRTPSPDAELPAGAMSGIPNVGISAPVSWLADDRGELTTEQPGQCSDSFTGSPREDFTSTGAGDGHAGHYKRYPWQQPDGAS